MNTSLAGISCLAAVVAMVLFFALFAAVGLLHRFVVLTQQSFGLSILVLTGIALGILSAIRGVL